MSVQNIHVNIGNDGFYLVARLKRSWVKKTRKNQMLQGMWDNIGSALATAYVQLIVMCEIQQTRHR